MGGKRLVQSAYEYDCFCWQTGSRNRRFDTMITVRAGGLVYVQLTEKRPDKNYFDT